MADRSIMLRRAKGDLVMADIVITKLEVDPEIATDMAAFHCQQCVEKLLRYVYGGEDIFSPVAQDIVVLLEKVNDKTLTNFFGVYAETLNSWDSATLFKYQLFAKRSLVLQVMQLAKAAIEYVEETYKL